jgi:hypothetical protein
LDLLNNLWLKLLASQEEEEMLSTTGKFIVEAYINI